MPSSYLIPIGSADCNMIDLGDIKLFRDTGLVVLGNACFEQYVPIEHHEYSGCIAERGSDDVLVITTPTDVYRYSYNPVLECWYQVISNRTEAPARPVRGHLRAVYREYGPVLGTIAVAMSCVIWLFDSWAKLMAVAMGLGGIALIVSTLVIGLGFLVGALTGGNVNHKLSSFIETVVK